MAELSLQQALEQGLRHFRAGSLAQAESIFQQVLAHFPANADAAYMLGVIAYSNGRLDVAIEFLRRAVALQPDSAQIHYNLGEALTTALEWENAIAHYQQALALKPEYPEALINLGNALVQTGQIDPAIEAFQKAVSLRPQSPEAHSNLANAFQHKGRFEEAIACAQRALQCEPKCFEAYLNLGNALLQLNRLEQSIEAFERGVALAPKSAAAHNNLGNALLCAGRPLEAIPSFRAALVLLPHYHEARLNLALALLATGNFGEGWKEYEIRTRSRALSRPDIIQPKWDGSPLGGRRILLRAEQGIGDTIQFMRYIPMIQTLGGKIILECQAPLTRLLAGVPSVEACITREERHPEFDVQCSLLSLPAIFDTQVETIPLGIPYISADSSLAALWEAHLSGTPGLKVGLAWAGGPEHTKDRNRSIAFSSLQPILGLSSVTFISLQKGAASNQSSGESRLIDWTSELSDFADTAALISNLDLVITVDTSVAHLAGAMGKPVWVLLPFAPDWRWMLDREDSPWYPTMRLFRQQRAGEWQPPIDRMVEAIQGFAR
ncbi:MAG: tetratricopeptide repeat protein [Planctomycetota bacterium]|nr:tetratricopeptide repeat protein [Planctomycetota bacterium]